MEMELGAFWAACEMITGPAAVAAEWKRLAGPAYEAAKVFVRPTQERARSYPCPREPRCACFHRVVNHGGGRIVAVCDCDPRRCDTVELTESDIVVYELNQSLLFAAIADAMTLQPARADVPSLPWVTRIGFDSPCAGYRFPVYLILTPQTERFTHAIFTLAATNDDPFIVIAPTSRRSDPGCLQMLNLRKCLFLTLPDVLKIDGSGTPVASGQCDKLLDDFHLAIIPALQPDSSAATPIAFFPTPPNATWSDVQILFRDGHTVVISAGDKSGVYNFAQMGMSKSNTGTPTVQWELLEAFANEHGVLTWHSERADRRWKKQKHLLAQHLRRFFRIDDDPFAYLRDSKGWEAKFDIGFSS
jgi:hypothetical protein